MRMQKYWNVDLLVLATVLDPEYTKSIFDRSKVNIMYSTDIAEKLYENLFGEPVEPSSPFLAYLLGNERPFSVYRTFGKDSSPKQSFWRYVELSGNPYSLLAKLALRLEVCVCTTAATEMLFSEMEYLHSPCHNRLRVDRVVEMVQIRRFFNWDEDHHAFGRNHVEDNRDQEADEYNDAEDE
jgi:hypothetical protein